MSDEFEGSTMAALMAADKQQGPDSDIGIMVPTNKGTSAHGQKALNTDALIDLIRRSLIQGNKEVASYRLSASEKDGLADVLYSLKKRGLKSSEIEVARIAINWLLNDYNSKDDESILIRVLESKLN